MANTAARLQLEPKAQYSPSLQSFGLTSNPFVKASVGGYLTLTPATRHAFRQAAEAVRQRRGLVVLTGETGTGKTMVLNRLRSWAAERSMPVAYLFNPLLDVRNFFNFVAAEFGIALYSAVTGSSFQWLADWLRVQHARGGTPLLIVDEAQGLPTPVLQSLEFLVQLETGGEKLLQVVLAGLPELHGRFAERELRHLGERVALRCSTSPLNAAETCSYVDERLRAANSDGHSVFSPDALDCVHAYSGGIPRLINLLCEHSLRKACREHVRPVPAHLVEEVAREFQFDADPRFRLQLEPAEEAEPVTAAEAVAEAPVHAETEVAPGGVGIEEPAAEIPVEATASAPCAPSDVETADAALPIESEAPAEPAIPEQIDAASSIETEIPQESAAPAPSTATEEALETPPEPLVYRAYPRAEWPAAFLLHSLFSARREIVALAAARLGERVAIAGAAIQELWFAVRISLEAELSKERYPESLRRPALRVLSIDLRRHFARARGSLLRWLREPVQIPALSDATLKQLRQAAKRMAPAILLRAANRPPDSQPASSKPDSGIMD